MKQAYPYILALLLLASCSLHEEQATKLNRKAVIFPDYTETTMPCNMAAPTFAYRGDITLEDMQAVFSAGENKVVVGNNDKEGFCIDNDEWHKLINESESKSESKSESPNIKVKIQGKKDGAWVEYDAFTITISPDSIDPNIAYRLVEPGYEVWNKMGIYERCLENYEEKAIKTNAETEGGCMNCHSFCNYDRNKMVWHQRKGMSGTYFYDGKTTKHIEPSPSFVYPSWHPGGRFIAFSTNDTKQAFHTVSRNRIEVLDNSSDIIVYDTQTEDILICPELHSATKFETFPSWSPDGKRLFFCCADSVNMPDEYDKAHYALCSIDFDAESRTFGNKVDTLYNKRSVSFPRISPDNRFLMFTLSDYGQFSIWHKDADLYLMDLQNDSIRSLDELNSKDVESYHSWSSNGKWIVFSTRRDDGLYTRPYFAHFENGKFSKPFALPQIDADYSARLMKSYNIPEFFR